MKKQPNKEICFTCEKRIDCRAEYTINKQPHPVQCVHYQRESDYKIVHHDNHKWRKASTNYSHMQGLSNLVFCTKCGAEGAMGLDPSQSCYDKVLVKKYRVGGIYKKNYYKEP